MRVGSFINQSSAELVEAIGHPFNLLRFIVETLCLLLSLFQAELKHVHLLFPFVLIINTANPRCRHLAKHPSDILINLLAPLGWGA